MVEITPNAPNLDHAKKKFFTGSVVCKEDISPKKVSFLPFVPFCAFFQTAGRKKTIKNQINYMIPVENDVLLAEIGR